MDGAAQRTQKHQCVQCVVWFATWNSVYMHVCITKRLFISLKIKDRMESLEPLQKGSKMRTSSIYVMCKIKLCIQLIKREISCIPDPQLKINVVDKNPVQKHYNSIPKSLHKEVKTYEQNLLDRGWIYQSVSLYSSPMVCVQKNRPKSTTVRGLN